MNSPLIDFSQDGHLDSLYFPWQFCDLTMFEYITYFVF